MRGILVIYLNLSMVVTCNIDIGSVQHLVGKEHIIYICATVPEARGAALLPLHLPIQNMTWRLCVLA